MISKVTIRSALINILQIIVFSYKLFFDNAKNPNILALKFEYFSISLFLKRVLLFKEINMF